ncbi:hypothetical protein [Streptococcus salivarius]|uniref:hypothetical protein n=1 Tax=Streptococcus salivarius TaxID=1304 RepID=UPI0022E47961|nr:hypothetical protein [Streptococcus salivarius]
MTKELKFNLGRNLEKLLQSPIRNQLDLIHFSLETVRDIITPNSLTHELDFDTSENEEGFRIVFPDKDNNRCLQRVFFNNRYEDVDGQSMNTIQSFVFPFIIERDEKIGFKVFGNFSMINHFEFNASVISQLVTVINIIDDGELTWGDTWLEELLGLLYGENKTIDTIAIFYIVNELLMFDFAYLRFDNDPKHVGENHPLYHLDTHLDNKGTYKIGLHEKYNISDFVDLLDNGSKISFIEQKKRTK